MVSDRTVRGRKPRRRLTTSQKDEIFVSALTGLANEREEIERLHATIAEQAIALHLHEGRVSWD